MPQSIYYANRIQETLTVDGAPVTNVNYADPDPSSISCEEDSAPSPFPSPAAGAGAPDKHSTIQCDRGGIPVINSGATSYSPIQFI